MTQEIIKAGTPTATSAPVEARDSKIMILAIHRGQDDQIVITPIDVEHTNDDLTELSDSEFKARKLLDSVFKASHGPMMESLAALYEIFDHRLYRNQFRTFENFCFAIYGTSRINDVLMKRVKQRSKALEAEVRGDA